MSRPKLNAFWTVAYRSSDCRYHAISTDNIRYCLSRLKKQQCLIVAAYRNRELAAKLIKTIDEINSDIN